MNDSVGAQAGAAGVGEHAAGVAPNQLRIQVEDVATVAGAAGGGAAGEVGEGINEGGKTRRVNVKTGRCLAREKRKEGTK